MLVNLPNGTQASFPDDMPHDQIESVIKSHLDSSPSEVQNPSEKQSPEQESSVLNDAYQSVKGAVTDPAGSVISGISGARNGVVDAAGDMGDMYLNLLEMVAPKVAKGTISKIHGVASDVGSKFKDLVHSSPIDQQAQQDHPIINAVGSGAGYVGANLALSAPIAKTADAGLEALSPLSKTPTFAAQALRSANINGVLGATMGAGSEPENPLWGAIKGGTIGFGTGLGLGYLGAKTQRSAAVIKDVEEDATKAGFDPKSMNVKNDIKANLASGGKQLSQEENLRTIESNIRNDFTLQPKEVRKAQIDKLYQPLNDSVGSQSPLSTLSTIKESGKFKLGLPDEPLPEKPTIKDLMQYKRLVHEYKSNAWGKVENNDLIRSEAQKYSNLDNALEKDIKVLSLKQGLGDQYKIASKAAFDDSIMEDFDKAFQNSLSNKENMIMPTRFQRQMNRILNDPKTKANPEMVKLGTGLRDIAAYGRDFMTGAGNKSGSGWMKNLYEMVIHNEAGIALIKALGSISPTSKAFRDIAQKLITGTIIHMNKNPKEQDQPKDPLEISMNTMPPDSTNPFQPMTPNKDIPLSSKGLYQPQDDIG